MKRNKWSCHRHILSGRTNKIKHVPIFEHTYTHTHTYIRVTATKNQIENLSEYISHLNRNRNGNVRLHKISDITRYVELAQASTGYHEINYEDYDDDDDDDDDDNNEQKLKRKEIQSERFDYL